MDKKLPNGWIRDTSQEKDDSQRGGGGAYRWYQKKGGFIASLVDGDIVNEGEWRISGNDFDAIESRGDIHIMLNKSDLTNIRIIESLIRREKMR